MSNWFIAYPIPAGRWFPGQPPPPAGTRLLAPADLHLTIAFLGSIGEQRAREALEGLSSEAFAGGDIVLGPLTPMGNPKRPSVFAALAGPVDADDGSFNRRLASARDASLAAAGLPAEKRAMKPHVTLARLRRRATRDERRRAADWAAAYEFARVRIALDRVALYTAARNRGMRAYDIVATRATDRS